MNDDGGITILIVLFLLFVAYFWPTILAFKKDHPHKLTIFILNLAVSWTLLGWIYLTVSVMRERKVFRADRGYRPSPYRQYVK